MQSDPQKAKRSPELQIRPDPECTNHWDFTSDPKYNATGALKIIRTRKKCRRGSKYETAENEKTTVAQNLVRNTTQPRLKKRATDLELRPDRE